MNGEPRDGALRHRALVVIALALALATLGPASPAAAAQAVPDDVVAAFSDEALREAKSINASEYPADDAGAADFADAVGFGLPRQVHLWSSSLLETGVTGDPVIAIEEWVAPILDASGESVGLYRVWRPDPRAPAEFAGYDADAESAAAISAMDSSTTLVSDPTIGGWYSLRGGELSALNHQARAELPDPAVLDSVAPLISARHHESVRQSAGIEGAAGGASTTDQHSPAARAAGWAAMAALVVAGGVIAVIIVRRHRQADDHHRA